MTTLTEGQHAGEFMVSEANGHRSRETVTILSGENLPAGMVLGKVTASGKYKEFNTGSADGSENAVAVLFDAVDATAGDTPGVIIARDAEVNLAELQWFTGATQGNKDTGVAGLLGEGIIAR